MNNIVTPTQGRKEFFKLMIKLVAFFLLKQGSIFTSYQHVIKIIVLMNWNI